MSKRNIEAVYDLSPMQQGMLFESLYRPESGVYVEQMYCTLRGDLDTAAFKRAWQQVVSRHAVLRTSFVWKNLDRLLQVVMKEVELPFVQEDWRSLAPGDQAGWLEQHLTAERNKGFDLSKAPLMRLALFRTADDVYAFTWTHHHILLDGWSLPLLLSEVFASYEAACNGKSIQLEAPQPYNNYINWLKGQDTAAAEAYWRKTLAGFAAPTPLSVDNLKTGDEANGPTYGELQSPLSYETSAALEALARQHHLTLNTLMQGAWALLLSRYSGEDDVLFGATVSGRPADLPGAESMVGLFINTLPLRVQIDADAPVIDWLKALQTQAVEMRQYEYSPLVDIQRWSELPPGQPLFDSILVFENYPVDGALLAQPGGLTVEDFRTVEQTEFPLTIVAAPGDEIMLKIAYDGRRFSSSTILRMLGHLETLIEGIAAEPGQRIGTLPVLTPAERERLLIEWNDTAAPFPADKCVHQLIETRVEAAPEATALRFGGKSMSYGELNRRANQLAHLLQARGVGPEVLVGLLFDRSFDMIVAMLGVLKAGGAYLPIDPAYPAERIGGMIEDSGTGLLITQEHHVETLPPHMADVLCLDADEVGAEIAGQPVENPPSAVKPDNLAYVIYTSGSTGRPKGTLLRHRGLVNQVTAYMRAFNMTPDDHFLQFFSYGFDGSVLEIFPALASGGTLVLAPRETLMSPDDLHALLRAERVTMATMPPAMLALLPSDDLPDLRFLMSAGEALPLEVAARWQKGRHFYNGYGPTENTVCATWQEITAQDIRLKRLPIGRPVQNVQAYVLDAQRRLVPVGVPGELYIGGVAVARGYLNRPDLTAEKFIPDPVRQDPGARLYRTGDRVRWLPDGTLEFLGRTDFQVKIRGFRVELGEIENALVAHPAVRQAVVTAHGAGAQKWLAAYLVPDGDTPSANELREFLLQTLPDYMVPAAYVVLDELPLNTSGKVNRRVLPAPDGAALAPGIEYVAPRTPAEEVVAALYGQILGAGQVGRSDDFFSLGGHSLLATRLISRLREAFKVELPLASVFEAPTVADMAERVEQALHEAAGLAAPPVERVARTGSLPLSFAQQRLWFLDQLAPGSLFYNLPMAVKLSGDLNVEALKKAVNEIVKRHEVLRTTFAAEGGQPVQVIADELTLDIPVEDVSQKPEAERDAVAEAIVEREARTPFDLAAGPLLRVRLVKLAADEHIAIMVMHHIAADGWSLGVLVGELAALYEAYASHQTSPLPALKVQYADYAAWQRDWLRGDVLDAQLAYWDEQLKGAPGLLELPTDRPRPAVQTSNGATFNFNLPEDLSERVKAFSREAGATNFMTLLAAFDVLLARYSGQDDISVGTAIAGRGRTEVEPLIGFFVNTLVMRTDLSDEPTFKELVGRVRQTALGAYAHQDVPFEMLVERLRPERDMSHTPLFQVGFALQNTPMSTVELPELTISPLEVDRGSAQYDMLLTLSDASAGLAGSLEYNTDLFDAPTAGRLVEHFERLLSAALADPDAKVGTLPLLGEAERQMMLVEWNDTAAPYPASTAHALFEGWAEKQPGAEALVLGGEVLTYGELNTRANKLAHTLIEKGVERGTLVGISTERSFEMLVGILGVMKAGGAYLPIDPTYPADRISFMIEDSGIRLLLTQDHLVDGLPTNGAEVIRLDADWPQVASADGSNPALSLTPEDLAYVIYTSGSTGRPKGVLLRHRGLANLCTAQKAAFDIAPGRRVLQFSPFSFDASVWETVMALCNGGSLVLAQAEQLVPGAGLLSLLRDQHVNVVTLPPSALAVLEPGELPDLGVVVAAGERCTAALVSAWSPGRRFFNAYGPTETTVCASWHECPDQMEHDPPIGKPLPNVQLTILDKQGQPQPIGVPGELAVGGAGVAVGYHHRPDLTATKFVADEFSGTGMLYKTGDLCRWLPDGNVEFLGRTDDQVKVRGFRIELGEVEAALRALPEVLDAVVTPHNDALAAYLVAPPDVEETPGVPAIRAELRRTLPDYMVPGWTMWLDAFPLSPAGKVDRKALPAPDGERPDLASEYVAPESESEIMLAEIVQELLNIERVGIYDDFFELGGHSLLATQAVARVREQCGVELPLRALFETPHVAGLAKAVDELRDQSAGMGRISDMLEQLSSLSDEEVQAMLEQNQA